MSHNLSATTMVQSQQCSSKLQELPMEILVQILALIPFKKTTVRILSQVCRRFREITKPQNQQQFLRLVANLQFPRVAAIYRRQLNFRCDITRVRGLQRTHDNVSYIVREIKSCMTEKELASEPVGWERDLFDCLMLWRTVNRLCAGHLLLIPRGYHHFIKSTTLEARLALRHVCVRVALCLVRLLQRVTERLNETRPDGPRYIVDCPQHPDKYLFALQLFLLHNSGLHGLADVISGVQMTYDELLLEEERKITNCMSFDKLVKGSRHRGQHVWICRNSGRHADDGSLFHPVRVMGDNPTSAGYSALIQEQVISMVRAAYHPNKPDLADFMCKWAMTGGKASSTDSVELTEGKLDSTKSPVFVWNHNRNETTRLALERSWESPGDGEVRMPQFFFSVFDWESELDLQLLHSYSRLRQSMPPFREIFEQTYAATKRLKRM